MVLSIDVHATLDCLALRHVAEQLWARGATAAQVAVVLRERVGVRVQPRVGPIRGPWQTLEKGTRQGGARSLEL